MWLFGKGSKSSNSSDNKDHQSVWNVLNNIEQLNDLKKESHTKHVVIFKHSTTCSISAMAKSRLKNVDALDLNNISLYYLDLLKYRSVSNAVEEVFGVKHESPQVIIIKEGVAVNNASHNAVSLKLIEDLV